MTQKGIELIKEFEGFRANAYWDATGKVWTIGYGATFYMDGSPVKKGDTITLDEATELLNRMVSENFEKYVDLYVTSDINPYQRDALTSFTYNCGPGNLKRSNLLKKVNADPSDLSIRNEFLKWNKSGGKVLNGLTRRRNAEADLYFTEYTRIQNPVVEEKKNLEEPVIAEKVECQIEEKVELPTEKNDKSSKKSEKRVGFFKRLVMWFISAFSGWR